MVTIKDIATMANVSRSTVSRVLNNSGYVSEEARKRVEKVIEETGYVPSGYAKSLRTKQTKVIGVILPTIQTETPSRVVTGLGRELSKHGYQILLANTDHDKEKELEYLDLLVRQVDGIVLIATNTEPELTQKIKSMNLPFVMVGQEAENVICVTYDDYHVARDVTAFLVDKGHTQIGFIGVDETDQAVGCFRKKGFYDEMKSHDLPIEEAWVQKGVFDIDSGCKAMKKIIEDSKQRPTAIFAVTDRLAIGAMSYVKRIGMEIPKDIAIAGIGASELSQYVDPPLTTVDYKNETAGEEAAKQLLAFIQGEDYQKKFVLDYRLLSRDSV
ncbi:MULTISPECIES: LacI family DNA-binding transcriptional regulator [Virgibacillus]|uniref:HTH-type transcriptional repressor CytR n=1 Tax=Virgibacillus dokdonensis TaxID=302167 RepID=A0A2K9IUK0_9BACI|nr:MULTISPECIES: LacI family DNA-binding transcriptional regulator [Virgibacillus]AUJ23459.1 HTH-type transcriptional repressor CytR [Virgibacillus dokdonensis]NWO12024.1 LacI family DNA-binding transcriptional regulator [Virgibacillus sp.]